MPLLFVNAPAFAVDVPSALTCSVTKAVSSNLGDVVELSAVGKPPSIRLDVANKGVVAAAGQCITSCGVSCVRRTRRTSGAIPQTGAPCAEKRIGVLFCVDGGLKPLYANIKPLILV